MQLEHYARDHGRETDEQPYHWIDRSRPAGRRAHTCVWVERDVPGFDMDKWTVRKEEFDDDGRGQHMPTNLSGHTSKESARKAAVEWMREH